MAKNKIEATLSGLQYYLNQHGYETVIQPATDFTPSEQLLVGLGKDSQGKDVVLRLFWSKGVEETKSEEVSEENLSEPHFLQFFILFPFVAMESALKDLTTLIFNVNASFDMASFGLFEAQRLVYYRYVHIYSSSEIESENFLSILVSIEFLLEMLLPSLTDVALGKKSLIEVQKEAETAAREQNLNF